MADKNDTQNFRDSITESITEIKINQVKHEASQARMNEILAKLTTSVEYHILRSDNLEELVNLYKENAEQNLANELAPIKSHISFIKGATATLAVVGALIMALHQMGILQKLF
jgi:hypothetical protein